MKKLLSILLFLVLMTSVFALTACEDKSEFGTKIKPEDAWSIISSLPDAESAYANIDGNKITITHKYERVTVSGDNESYDYSGSVDYNHATQEFEWSDGEYGAYTEGRYCVKSIFEYHNEETIDQWNLYVAEENGATIYTLEYVMDSKTNYSYYRYNSNGMLIEHKEYVESQYAIVSEHVVLTYEHYKR